MSWPLQSRCGPEMRVLIAPDKFKGTLTALEVATAIAQGLAAAGVTSTLLPLADGGDGSVTAALHAGFTSLPVAVRGADGHRHDTEFAFDGTTAVVEVAGTCGLSTLPPGELAPMTSSSYGFGQAVAAAHDAGARGIVVRLGGGARTERAAATAPAGVGGCCPASGHGPGTTRGTTSNQPAGPSRGSPASTCRGCASSM